MNNSMKMIKEKYRFFTARGMLNAESLWDLPIKELNSVVIQLKEELAAKQKVGYLDELNDKKDYCEAKTKFEFAEEVIIYRVKEIKSIQEKIDNKAKRDKLLSIIASKEAQKLEENDVETLKEMAESLK